MTQAKTLTSKELKHVLEQISLGTHAKRDRAMLLTLFYSGMRVGEVAALLYSDVVDESGEVKKEIKLAAEQTKGGVGGIVYVSDKLIKELKDYLKAYPCTNKQHKLFYTQKNKARGFTANTLAQHFYHLFKRCGISGASSHSGRRTFITNLAEKGVGVRVLQSLARHKSISTTQVYIDVNDAMKRKAVELV